MNLKFVYKQNVHKLPQSVKTYSDLVSCIQNLYPVQLKIFYNTPDAQLIQIENDFQFQVILDSRKRQGSIKFLALDPEQGDPTPQDIVLLNQSMIFPQVQSEEKESFNLNELLQNKEFQRFLDIYFEKRLQQSGIFDELTALKAQQSILVTSIQMLEKNRDQSQQLVQAPLNKLQVNHETESFTSEYLIENSITKITVTPGQQFLWEFTVRNNSGARWPNQMYIRCLQGAYVGVTEKAPSVGPYQIYSLQVPLEAMHHLGTFCTIWRFFYINRQNRNETFFGQEMTLQITVSKDQLNPHLYLLPPRYSEFQYHGIVQKAREVQNILKEQPMTQLVQFIEQRKMVDFDPLKIVDAFLNNQEDEKEVITKYHKPTMKFVQQ